MARFTSSSSSSSRLFGTAAAAVVVALLLVLAAAADPTPLANQPTSGQGTITAAQSSFEIQLDNTLSGPSILVWFAAGMTAGYNDSSAIPAMVTVSYQATNGSRGDVLQIGIGLLSNLSLPSAVSIPACSSYSGNNLGDKIGTWWLQVSFTDVAGLPEDAAANVSLTLVAQATGLADQGTTYSQQNLGSASFGTFVLPALNSSFSGYNVTITLSDLSSNDLSWLSVVDFTSDASCQFGSKGSPPAVSPNTTAATTTITLSNLAAGTWQIRASNTANVQPTIGMSWTAEPIDQPESSSWWTTEHIIYVALAVVGVLVLFAIVAGAVAWYVIKRRRQYEEV